ncbi:MAG: tetratricopeptide repeat protein, partial [Planctomycetales bacterium]|nr:tetratricopeptide repeat protein [Planctomycetales bacterium]
LLRDNEVRLTEQQSPLMLAEAHALRGRLLLSLDSVDKAAEALRNAARIAPDNPQIVGQLATAATSVDDLATAERAYRKYLELRPGDPLTLRALAGVEIRKQLRVDKSRRNWRRAQRAVQQAAQADPSSPDLVLLFAELAASQSDLTTAEKALREGVKAFPDQIDLLRGLAVNLGRQGNFAEALTVVRQYREASSDSVSAAALEADLQVQSGDRDAGLAIMEQVWKGAEGERLAEAALAYARLLFQAGRTDDSLATLEAAHLALPHNLRVVESAANTAAAIEDFQRLETYEKQLREIEGPDGAQWRAYRALRLLSEAQATSDPAFREAQQLVVELDQIRPQWSQTHYLEGEVARRMGNVGAAAVSYEQAWAAGGRNMQVADRLIESLTLLGREDDAAHYVRQIRGFLSLSARLFDRVAPYFANGADRDEALRLAEQWVARRPEDPFTHIRLGRVLAIMADTDDDPEAAAELMQRASDEFQHAIQLHPDDVRPWVASVMFFAQNGQDRSQAVKIMQELSNQADISLLERAYVLAQLSETLGQTADAQHFYQ